MNTSVWRVIAQNSDLVLPNGYTESLIDSPHSGHAASAGRVLRL
jgi:hypothetical protein